MADILQRQRELRERQLRAQAAQQKSQQVSKRVQSQAEIEKFKAENVQLDTGEWVSKAEFEKLSAEDQARLKKLGIKGFNDYYQKTEADFKANNVQIKDGWISKAAYESLSPEDQQRIKELGIEGFNKYYEQKQAEFERNNVKLNTGEYVSKTEYNNLPSEWQSALKTYGVDGFQNWLSTAYPGAKGFIVIDDPNAGKMVYGKTDDPNIGIDAGGNRIWIGGRWPDAVKHYLQGVEIRGSEIISREQLQAEKLAAAQKVEGVDKIQPEISTIKTAGEAKPVSDLIKVGKDQYIDKEAFNALDPKYQKVLKTEGIEAFQKEYAKDHVRLDDGTYISNETWAHLSKEDQELANKEGYEAVLKKNTVELKSGELVDKAEFEMLPPVMQAVAKEQGLDAIDLSKLKPEQQFEKMKEWKLVDKDAEFAGVDETGQILIKGKEADIPWTEKYLTTEMAKGVAVGMIPIAGTLYHWEKMKPWERGLSIALDVATFIPFVGAVSAGVRAGGKLTAVVGRAALAEAKAPITAVMHPVATAKTMIYPIETALRPTKIPLTALEIRSSTVRLPVKDIGKAEDAMQARDIITKAAIMGDTPAVEIAGKNIELTKVALQQKISPAAVHTTPDIRPFLSGAEIQSGREGGLFVSPSMHTRFTGASAFGDAPKGGIPGALIIRDESVLAKLQPSGKIYRGTAEIEQVIGAGAKLPPPSQILMTRDINGNKLTLAIIGKPLSKTEIARLKFTGSVDLVKDIFRPAAKISGKGIDELAELGDEARNLEKALSKAEKAGNTAEAKRIKADIEAINKRGRDLARATDLQYASRSSLRSVGISTDDFIDRISFNDLARSKPTDFARTMNELPRDERARIMNDLEKPLRIRITREMEKITRAPAARAERKPLKTIEPERILRAETVDRGTIKTDRERLPIEERAIVPGREPVTPVERQAVPVKESVPPRIDKSQIKTIISKIESESGKKTKVTEKQLEGAVAWKQGMFYRMHYPPFGAEDKLVTREPIPGVRYEEGIGSAAKSAVTLYGEIPQNIRLDMGIVDIDIGRAERTGQPKLRFKADPKQKTRYSGYVKDQSSIKISK